MDLITQYLVLVLVLVSLSHNFSIWGFVLFLNIVQYKFMNIFTLLYTCKEVRIIASQPQARGTFFKLYLMSRHLHHAACFPLNVARTGCSAIRVDRAEFRETLSIVLALYFWQYMRGFVSITVSKTRLCPPWGKYWKHHKARQKAVCPNRKRPYQQHKYLGGSPHTSIHRGRILMLREMSSGI